MNQRVIRTGNAAARGTATTTPTLRTAQRKPVRQSTAGEAEVITSTHMGKVTVSETVRSASVPSRSYGDAVLGSVLVGHGKTIPTEQFANVRIDVKVTLPCTAEDLQSVAEEAHDHVVAIMQAEEDYLLGASPARTAQRRGR